MHHLDWAPDGVALMYALRGELDGYYAVRRISGVLLASLYSGPWDALAFAARVIESHLVNRTDGDPAQIQWTMHHTWEQI